jgi:hypothetical protein
VPRKHGSALIFTCVLFAMSPIVGIAVEVHYGKHKNAIGLHSINDPERKPVKFVLPNAANERAKGFCRKPESCNRGPKLIEKLTAKGGALSVIPFGGGNYFCVGVRMDDNPAH